ncbi:MAG: MbcA/ParS/Xre antitoxin family protein [Allosphingosinicella sp.]|uniref:MbcA/ParS/Xre antitoxin family protein n=1 Tax=Allosphingosinicella sp. TaxID=2823234 RepID=UPI00395EDC8E
MSEYPNILPLVESGHDEDATALLRKRYQVAAAAGPRSTKVALEAAIRLFGGDLRMTITFMNRPTPILNGDTPLERAERSEQDMELVLGWIGQIEAGVYV